MTPILCILAFTVGLLLFQLAIHLAWKRRRAKASCPSATVESVDRQLKALYSDDYLDSLIKQRTAESHSFPTILAEAVKRREEARGIVFKPGKPLHPVPAADPKDGES